MRSHLKFVRTATLALLSVALQGCAHTEYVKTEIPPGFVANSVAATPPDSRAVTIAIKWPFSITPSARELFKQNLISYLQSTDDLIDEDPRPKSVTEFTPVSSTYFAAELHEALRRKLPLAKILLDPQLVEMGPYGSLITRSATRSEIPVDLIVDIVEMAGGDMIFVLNRFSFVLRSPPALAGANCGLILAMDTELTSLEDVNPSGSCQKKNNFNTLPAAAWYLGSTRPTRPFTVLPTKAALPLSADSVTLYPTVRFGNVSPLGAYRSNYVVKSQPATPADVRVMEIHPHLVNLAAIVATAPTVLAASSDKDLFLVSYIAQYDKDLSAAVASGAPLSQAQNRNVQLIRKILDAELKVRTGTDYETTQWILAGQFGKSFRDVREKSFSGFNKMMGVAWIASAALVAAAPPAGSAMDVLSNNAAMMSQFTTIMDKFGGGLYKGFVPAMNAMEKQSIEFEGRQISVNKSDQNALRKSLQDLYSAYKL